jgi:enterobactin synthetase component D
VLGRHAAACALEGFGCKEVVGRNPDRSPAWPAGFIGSISHGAGLVVAAVAQTQTHTGLGIDVEKLVTAQVYEEVVSRILSTTECKLLARKLPNIAETARFSLGFSLKESLFKCIYPKCGEFFDFEDAELVSVTPDTTVSVTPDTTASGHIELSLTRALPGGFPRGLTLTGQFLVEEDHVETCLAASRVASP